MISKMDYNKNIKYMKIKHGIAVEQRARTGEPSRGSLGGGLAGFAESNRLQARGLAKPRQTLLADSKISLRSIFNAASARSAQYIYRRHFSANPFGFAAQRGVVQSKKSITNKCIDIWTFDTAFTL